MGGAYGMKGGGGEQKSIQGFGGDFWRKETTWKRRWENNELALQEIR